jgi:hypothetical protein
VSEFLLSLFDFETNLVLGKDIKIKPYLSESNKAIRFKMTATKSLHGETLTIKPKYFTLLPTENLDTENRLLLTSNSETENKNGMIQYSSSIYTKDELNAISTFRISRVFSPLLLNIPQ